MIRQHSLIAFPEIGYHHIIIISAVPVQCACSFIMDTHQFQLDFFNGKSSLYTLGSKVEALVWWLDNVVWFFRRLARWCDIK